MNWHTAYFQPFSGLFHKLCREALSPILISKFHMPFVIRDYQIIYAIVEIHPHELIKI